MNDENGELEPCLAESWEVSEDKLTWSFKIRENVKFSNGDDMTADMVKSSLERTFELSNRAPSFFEPESITTDGQTLYITTAEPVANLDGSLADPLFLIVDTNVDTDLFAMEGPICTGPYAVKSFNPNQLSGGMCQRVGIAIAMTFKPILLLADEPTSALDVTNQAQIVKHMMELRNDYNTSIIIVTHNIGVAAYMADKIIVMKDGKIMDCGTRAQVLNNPESDYTKELLNSIPEMEGESLV